MSEATNGAASADPPHPVFAIAMACLRPHADGRVELVPEGVAGLIYALMQHARDPALPEAVLSVSMLCLGMLQRPGAAGAGKRILEVLAIARPHLSALGAAAPDSAELEKHGARARDLPSNAARPEGAMSALGVRLGQKKSNKDQN